MNIFVSEKSDFPNQPLNYRLLSHVMRTFGSASPLSQASPYMNSKKETPSCK